MLPTSVDLYLLDGCMRCKLGATPACKVRTWQETLVAVRHVLQSTGLTEEVKWGVPCYTHGDKNIVLLSALKDSVTLSFFKGVLLTDPHQLLVKPGENSQIARYLRFTTVDEVVAREAIMKDYIAEAIKLEEQGAVVERPAVPESMPEELLQAFAQDPELETAFRALTPGRQRGYLIFFNQPKQSATRISRISKCREKILLGVGLQGN